MSTPATATIQLNQAAIECLPNYKKKTATEYSSACPICGGEDRFLFWPGEGNFFCRKCDLRGFVSDGNTLTFDREAWLRWQAQETERKREEEAKRLSLLDRLAQSGRAKMYHYQMTDRAYWYDQGLTDATIDRFELGYSPACPTCPDCPSYTIPVYYQGRLYNLRHRLKGRDKDKYRPEMAGLPSCIFNADALQADDWMTVLVEGEVKAMVLTQHGFNAAGIPGANNFKEKWLKLFSELQVIYVALDPGKEGEAEKIALSIKGAGVQVRLCTFPVKPDDFLVKYKGSRREFMQFLRLGERV